MTKCKININDNIEVELTEHGKMLYREVYGKTARDMQSPLTIQLWEFMNVFGDEFYTGSSPITKDNKIIVSGDVIE